MCEETSSDEGRAPRGCDGDKSPSRICCDDEDGRHCPQKDVRGITPSPRKGLSPPCLHDAARNLSPGLPAASLLETSPRGCPENNSTPPLSSLLPVCCRSCTPAIAAASPLYIPTTGPPLPLPGGVAPTLLAEELMISRGLLPASPFALPPAPTPLSGEGVKDHALKTNVPHHNNHHHHHHHRHNLSLLHTEDPDGGGEGEGDGRGGGGEELLTPHLLPPYHGEVYDCRWADCQHRFPSMEALVTHVNERHVKVERPDLEFQCRWEGCPRQGRGFNARYKMLIHIRTHTNEKPHKCLVCAKSFSRLENLKIHNRSHTGEKPYMCPVKGCSKAYSNSSDRFKHVRTHQEQKPYICKMPGCHKRYTDPSSLRKHVRTHGHFYRSASSGEALSSSSSSSSSSSPPPVTPCSMLTSSSSPGTSVAGSVSVKPSPVVSRVSSPSPSPGSFPSATSPPVPPARGEGEEVVLRTLPLSLPPHPHPFLSLSAAAAAVAGGMFPLPAAFQPPILSPPPRPPLVGTSFSSRGAAAVAASLSAVLAQPSTDIVISSSSSGSSSNGSSILSSSKPLPRIVRPLPISLVPPRDFETVGVLGTARGFGTTAAEVSSLPGGQEGPLDLSRPPSSASSVLLPPPSSSSPRLPAPSVHSNSSFSELLHKVGAK